MCTKIIIGFSFLEKMMHLELIFYNHFYFFSHTYRCEAMSENTDDIPGLDTLVNAITGESPVSSIPQTLASTFGNGLGGSGSRPPSIFGGGPSRPPTSSSAGSSLFSTFENLIFGKRRSAVPTGASHFSRPFGSQHRPVQQQRRPPQRFRQANNIRRPPIRRPTSSNSPFISRREDEAFRPSRPIRTKRQTRLQGNIIRLDLELYLPNYNS